MTEREKALEHLLWRLDHNDTAKSLCGEAAKAIRALLSDDGREAWQTIDTAPRDGTPLEMFTPTGDDSPRNVPSGLVWVSGGWGKAALNPDSFRGESSYGTPTHWRHLPPPPSPSKEKTP